MASVEIQTPDGVVRVRLDRDHFTIGRLATNDIALPYPHISRRHAELRLMGQTWWVVDLRSTNGLHIGGQRVGESKLTPDVPVSLSPLVTLHLLDELMAAPSYPQSRPQQPAAYPYPQAYAPPSQAPMTPSYPVSSPSYAPVTPSYPVAPPSQAPATPSNPLAPAREQITPLSALGPRSPYADDEAPFYPQMRPVAPAHHGGQPGFAPSSPNALAARPAYYPPSPSVAPGEMNSSVFDPQRQAAHVFEQRRNATAGPSPLLHVCQTCGQRTMPDAVYCQSCHHSIASECVRCRLSLLPIQDLCPRCQTPNPSSVRRFRRTTGPA